MSRNNRALVAQETLSIIDNGYYIIDEQKITTKEIIKESIANSEIFRPDSFTHILNEAASKNSLLNFNTEIIINNVTTLEAAQQLVKSGKKIGCLNFASAKNPGGGFLGGAIAQEESLALSSSLYPTLTKNDEMYKYNKHSGTYLYSDYMIYSPGVLVFRDDNCKLINDPYQIDILTSPAVNVGAMRTNKPSELDKAESTMLMRINKMLALFLHKNIEHLILGAWGCGVFQNNPKNIANYFAYHLLTGKYKGCFKSVYFAVYDRSKNRENISAFQSVFTS